jgi:hypothetical protein
MKTQDNPMTRSAGTFVVRLPRVQVRNRLSRAVKKPAHVLVNNLEIWDLHFQEEIRSVAPGWMNGLSVACHNTYVESLADGSELLWADPDMPTCYYCLKALERFVGAEPVEPPE